MTQVSRRVAWCGAVIALSGSAKAQDHRALAVDLFRQGSEAFERHDFAEAARAFEESHRHVPRAAAMYNAARSWDAAGDRPRAADDFETAIERTDLREPEAGAARARLAALEAVIGVVVCRGPSGAVISVAHAHGVATPARVHLEPGEYAVTAILPDGTRTQRTVSVVSQKVAVLTLQLATTEAPVPPKPVVEDTSSSAVPLLPIVAFSAAAGAGLTAAILGVEALDSRAAFNNNPSSQHALDEAHAYRNWANVAWAATVVFAVTGLVLFIALPKKTTHGPN